MCDKELLVGYLYDELDPSERAAFELHMHSCAACRDEAGDLRQTRAHLTRWAPPEPDFGYRIVRDAAAPQPVRAPARTWALAAAAALVLAASAAIANLEIRYDSSGFVVRTGWARAAAPATAGEPATTPQAVPAAAASEQWKGQLQLLQARLQQLENAQPAPGATAASGARMSDAELIRAVRRIVSESETRQERATARRIGQLWNDVGAMRAADLARVEQGLRQVQGVTNAELIQHRETLNRLWRVSQQR